MRMRLFSHNRGNAINTLRTAITEALSADVEGRILLLKNEGSRFTPRRGDMVINYGASNCPITKEQATRGGFTLLNDPAAIGTATNKRDFFRRMAEYNINNTGGEQVPLPEWTVDRATAQGWSDAGSTVYARDRLQGHSGEGIRVINETGANVGSAPLYTQGITGSRREYRIHVFKGEVILVQKKQRRSGWEQNDNYSDTVRNLDGGWVFSISSANPSAAVTRAAVNAITACGLDFGAVDILTKGSQGQEAEVFVLEVNTAPGQGGDTTTQRYVNAISAAVRGQAPYAPHNSNTNTEAPAVAPSPRPTPVAPAAPEVPPTAPSVETPRQATRASAAPQARVNGLVGANPVLPRNLDDCEEETCYFADVEGYREPVIVQHDNNAIFYIQGEEVPVTVTRLRSGAITFHG